LSARHHDRHSRPAGARDPALITNFWRIIEKYRLTHAGNVPTTLGALADIPVGDCDISSCG